MLKQIAVVVVLLFISSCGGTSTGPTCTGPTVDALKRIDAAVTNTDQITKGKYVALVADARNKLEEMQKCLPAEELNGQLNEHLRNALIYYDDAVDEWESGSNPRLKKYWELAREELGKIE